MNVPEKFQVKALISNWSCKWRVSNGRISKQSQVQVCGQGSNASNFKVVGVSTLTYFSKEHVTWRQGVHILSHSTLLSTGGDSLKACSEDPSELCSGGRLDLHSCSCEDNHAGADVKIECHWCSSHFWSRLENKRVSCSVGRACWIVVPRFIRPDLLSHSFGVCGGQLFWGYSLGPFFPPGPWVSSLPVEKHFAKGIAWALASQSL